MTCIIGCVDKNYMYIAGDSCGSNGHSYTIRKDDKIFKKGQMLFGYTTSFRMGHLLQWKLKIPKHPLDMSTIEYMNTLFIDEIIKCFTDNSYCKIDSNVKTGGNFLVLYKGRVFDIGNDYQVGENFDGVTTCGCGHIASLAAFKMAKETGYNRSISYILKKSLAITQSMIEGVQAPFNIIKMKYYE